MKLYPWLRNTHLWLGMLCGLGLLVYGTSAVQMAHNPWFHVAKPTVTEARVPLDSEAAASPRAAARALMDLHDMRGALSDVKETPGGFRFRIARPGTVYEVEVARAEGAARVKTSVSAFLFVLNRFHHLAGAGHEYWALNVWGVFVAFVSLSLLVLGGTGVYLWFKLSAERKVGAVLLAVSLGFALPLIIFLRLA